MTRTVISVENLGKEYIIGACETGYQTFREMMVSAAAAPFRRLKRLSGRADERIWALKDVSFEVKDGEVVGIIGRNGAGKSTLLKILSRITAPTMGRAEIRGRVSSLLEVGTGFHPELTGRENVYLNGAILGMSRAEIDRKFDEIVDFAGVETFLDTPVKRYSSGMQVRLAFAVAAHLEPEILMVDEVLAVGDIDFQKKCLGKMGEVAHQGRTVLFVSHNLSAVASLCTSGILFREGASHHYRRVEDAIASYLDESDVGSAFTGKRIDVSARANRVKLGTSEAVSLEFQVTLRGPLRNPRVGIGINDSQGIRLATIFTETMVRLSPLKKGQTCVFNALTEPVYLSPGTVLLKVSLADEGSDIEVHHDAIHVVIPEYDSFKFPPMGKPLGPIRLPLERISVSEVAAIPA